MNAGKPGSFRLLIVLAAGLLSAMPLPAAPASSSAGKEPGNARVRMLAKPSRPSVGTTVLVKLKIKSKGPVASVPFHLHFDPAVLKFERAVEGTFLNRGGAQTAFFAELASTGDEVIVGLSRLGQDSGVKGKGTLCLLEFRALGSGDAGLTFTNEKLKDTGSMEMPAVFDTASVTVR